MEPEEVVFDAENTMCKIYLKLHLKEALLAATFFIYSIIFALWQQILTKLSWNGSNLEDKIMCLFKV